MHDWPNAPSSDPVKRLLEDVHRGGSLALTPGELGARFGIQRLTTNARAQMAADLAEAGLTCTPALADAQRSDDIMLTAAPQRIAATTRRRWPSAKWLAAVPAILL